MQKVKGVLTFFLSHYVSFIIFTLGFAKLAFVCLLIWQTFVVFYLSHKNIRVYVGMKRTLLLPVFSCYRVKFCDIQSSTCGKYSRRHYVTNVLRTVGAIRWLPVEMYSTVNILCNCAYICWRLKWDQSILFY